MAIRHRRSLEPELASLLHGAATRALEARAAGDRRYLARFEHEIATAWSARRPRTLNAAFPGAMLVASRGET